FAVVRAKPDDRPAPPDWLAAFFRARASLLFVGAIVPAIVCYQVAFVFETSQVARRVRTQLAGELRSRELRIRAETPQFALCDGGARGLESCDRVNAFVASRINNSWDVDVPGLPWPISASALEGEAASTFVDRMLTRVTISDLPTAPAKPSENAKDAHPLTFASTLDTTLHARFWLVAAGLLVAAYLIARPLLEPLCVLDVENRLPPAL